MEQKELKPLHVMAYEDAIDFAQCLNLPGPQSKELRMHITVLKMICDRYYEHTADYVSDESLRIRDAILNGNLDEVEQEKMVRHFESLVNRECSRLRPSITTPSS